MILINSIFDGASPRKQIELGAPGVAITHNVNLAWELKVAHPELYVSARPLLYGGAMPSDAAYRQAMADARGLHDLIVIGLNENDHDDVTTVEGIKRRAAFDARQWAWAKSLGYTYVGFGASVGCPDFKSRAICQAMHDHYKPLWDAGMWMNTHLYSGDDHSGILPKDHLFNTDIIEDDFPRWDGSVYHFRGRRHIYLERRWELWFNCCGFNPNSTAVIWCDECGPEWGGGGGIQLTGWNDQQVGVYYQTLQIVESAPFVMDGVEYQSPVKAVAAFERGDPKKWGGYEHSDSMIVEIGKACGWRR